MADKKIILTFSNGDRFSLPASVVADKRARYYADRDDDATYRGEYEFTMSDDYELSDYLGSNMNWCDIEKQATKLPNIPDPISYDSDFVNVQIEVQD